MIDLSIILPTFNERDAIIHTIIAIEKVLKRLSLKYELIVCDDDSPDGTAKIVREYKKSHQDSSIQLIVRKNNHGLGLSIKRGILYASGSIIIGMDADGNHNPVTIPFLLEKLKSNRLVVASRFIKYGGMKNSIRYYPTKFINTFFWMLGMPVKDSTSGYYACRKKDLQKLSLDRIYYGYGDYHLRLVWFAKLHGWHVSEVPTVYENRNGGTSKSKFISMLITYTAEIFRLRNIQNDQTTQ